MIARRGVPFNGKLGGGSGIMEGEPSAKARPTVPQTTLLPDIAGLERPELESLLQAGGIEPYRARQLYRWVFKRGVSDFGRMTDLSKALRARLP